MEFLVEKGGWLLENESFMGVARGVIFFPIEQPMEAVKT